MLYYATLYSATVCILVSDLVMDRPSTSIANADPLDTPKPVTSKFEDGCTSADISSMSYNTVVSVIFILLYIDML